MSTRFRSPLLRLPGSCRVTILLALTLALPAANARAEPSTYAEPPALSLRIAEPSVPALAASPLASLPAPLPASPPATSTSSPGASPGASPPATPAASRPASGDAVAAALEARGTDPATLASLFVVPGDAVIAPDRTAAAQGGPRIVRLAQRVQGLPVHGGALKAVYGPGGVLVHLAGRLAPVPAARPLPADIDERSALSAALARLHPAHRDRLVPGVSLAGRLAFRGDPYFQADPSVTRTLVPQADGRLAEGFVVDTWSHAGNRLDLTLVGGDGRVLSVEPRTASDSYHVFERDPAAAPQTVVEGPRGGAGTGQQPSPQGWLDAGPHKTIDISGNNVHAYLDALANDAPDPGGTAVTAGSFMASANLTSAPTTAANRAVAVQNLFYLVNRVHDVLFEHGFDEAAGNFQRVNYSKSGRGNDPVLAEAQDGSGTDNANFATPPDGVSPRMQMYLWTAPSAGGEARDGDLDADIVYHEYGHGLTHRMIGGMDGPLAGAVGEGASDVVSFLMNGRDVLAPYASGDPKGIRRHRYTAYPLTYADVRGASVHDDGEVYAAAMWRLRELWLASGRSNEALFGLFVDGMNYTASRPAFEDMRNGLLDSIVRSGGNDAAARCTLVWRAFAQFGIGAGASGTASGGRPQVVPSTVSRKTCDRT